MRHQLCIRASASTSQQNFVPPRTVADSVSQCRSAFRAFREEKASGRLSSLKSDKSKPHRLTIELPLPVKRSLLNPFSDDPKGERIREVDQGDWPGGVIQQYRALRPLIDSVFDGYGAEFVGMLGAPEDGMGVWKMDDTTLVCNVIDLTFAQFAKLCYGEFGKRPLDPEHTIIVVNLGWTSSKNIGQLWDRKLKQQAKELVDDAHWEALYCCRPVRTSKGAHGLLTRCYPLPWYLHARPTDDADITGPCLLKSANKPEDKVVSELLNKQWPSVQQQFKDYIEERNGWGKLW